MKNLKNKKPRLQLIIAILVASALVLAEIYVMMNQPNNFLLMIVIGICVLLAIYFVLDAVLDHMEEKEIANREQFDTISRSEKASYTLLRKNIDEIAKNMKETGDNSEQAQQIINAQKAAASLSINKTKEVSEKIAELREIIEKSQNDTENQDRIYIELNNLEASLNDRIQGLSEKLSGFQEEIERLVEHMERINTDAIHEAVKKSNKNKFVVENVVLEDEILPEIDVKLEPEPVVIPEAEPAPEPIVVPEPVVVPEPPKVDNPNEKMNQDDIAALIASMTGGDAAPEPEPISEPEPEPIPEPIEEEKPPMPDLSNPNKMMTPEEIAALLANM